MRKNAYHMNELTNNILIKLFYSSLLNYLTNVFISPLTKVTDKKDGLNLLILYK